MRRRQPPTYAGYVRVSRVGDRDEDRLRSPQFQREAVERYASSRGLALAMQPDELDVSGSRASRPVLDAIIQRIENGELAGIVVAHLDRLSRLAPRERLELFERIEAAGGEVHTASGGLLSGATPDDRMMREIFLAVARNEWEKRRDGFAVAKANAIEQGIAVMAVAPYGYRFTPEHRLEVVREEADVVCAIFELRASGGSLGAALELFERETGRSSSRQAMAHFLGNRVYLGELRNGSYVNASAHEGIVALELFEAVQAVQRERAAAHAAGGARGRAVSLLAGIVRCGSCGSRMARTTNGKGQTSYRCQAERGHCQARASIAEGALDSYVVARVLGAVGEAADVMVEVELELDGAARRIEAEARLERAREQRVALREQELAALGEASELEVARATLRQAFGGELTVAERRELLAVVLEAVVVARAERGTGVAERVELLFASSTGAVAEDAREGLEQAAG